MTKDLVPTPPWRRCESSSPLGSPCPTCGAPATALQSVCDVCGRRLEPRQGRPVAVLLLALVLVSAQVVTLLMAVASAPGIAADTGFGLVTCISLPILAVLGLGAGVGLWLGKWWGWWLGSISFARGVLSSAGVVVIYAFASARLGLQPTGLPAASVCSGARLALNLFALRYLFRAAALEHFGLSAYPRRRAVTIVVAGSAVAAVTTLGLALP